MTSEIKKSSKPNNESVKRDHHAKSSKYNDIVGLSGSPRQDGNTQHLVRTILSQGKKEQDAPGVYQLSELNISGCRACSECRTTFTCSLKDGMSELYKKLET